MTLLASILIYGHKVNLTQFVGLAIAVGAMVFNFLDKGKKKGGQCREPAKRTKLQFSKFRVRCSAGYVLSYARV